MFVADGIHSVWIEAKVRMIMYRKRNVYQSLSKCMCVYVWLAVSDAKYEKTNE